MFFASGIQSIVIPNSVTSIGKSAFDFCESLHSVSLPNDIKILKQRLFFNCTKLESITIPSSVLFIETIAFASCKGLKNVICLAETPPSLDIFAFSQYNATLYVNNESIDLYKTTNPWSKFTTIKRLEELDPNLGIGAINLGERTNQIYDLKGNRVDKAKTGVNIIRTDNGKVKKVVIK